MKKNILTLLLLGITICSFGQWEINGSNIYYNQGNVGIGLSEPIYRFEIEGVEDYASESRTFIRLINKSVSHNSGVSMKLYAGESGSFTSLSHMSDTYTASPNHSDFGQLFTTGAGLMLRARDGIIRFETSSELATFERMRINKDGFIGIGTTEPKAKVQVAEGDIYISDISKGIIMKSPNGQCWKGTINNDGVLNFVQMYCPGSVNNINDEQNINYNITISPNPTSQYVSIVIDKKDRIELVYKVIDLNGRNVQVGNIMSNNEIINIEHLVSGMYIINIYDLNGNILTSEKTIKK